MSKFTKWEDISKTVNPLKAGYSDMRIWPLQLVFYTAIVIYAPLVGWVWATVFSAVGVFFMFAAVFGFLKPHKPESETEETTQQSPELQ